MFKHTSIKSGFKDIVLASIFILITVLLMILLLYGHIWPKHQFKDIDILKGFYVIVPIISVIIYSLFLKMSRSFPIFDLKYVHKSKVNWNLKMIILFIALIFDEIGSDIVYNGTPENQKGLDKADTDFLTTLFGSGFQAPVLEEFVFRGLLFLVIMAATSFIFKRTKLKHDFLGIALFIITSSVIFGLLHVIRHGDYEHIMTYTVSGLTYSVVFALTRDIKLPIILHMLNNIPITLNDYGYEWITGMMLAIFFVIYIISCYKLATSREFIKLMNDFRNWSMYQNYKFRKKKAMDNIKLT